ncbi:MAG: hypothetical protein KF851_08595 [Pirellulaceae bacterium]|nr:hypothetical protein [Pirellulaceae bacterium]
MHARHQLEVAGWIAAHADTIVASMDCPDEVLFESFWLNTKTRTLRWHTALKTFELDLANPQPNYQPWPALEIILEEIIVSESLTRIWAAMAVALDERFHTDHFSPLGRSIFIGHMETRNRVMRMLLRFRSLNEVAFDRFNQIRRSVEKWTDLFLGLFPWPEIATQFAFDPKRLEEHHRENQNSEPALMADRIRLWLASAEKAFSICCGKWSANPELNRRIVEGIFASIDLESFDDEPLPAIIRTLQRERAHADAQALLDQLTVLDA